ncbi:hypothetical protein ACFE04_019876 [Oxalis oulophora]
MDDGRITRDQREIKTAMVDYYQDLLGSELRSREHLDTMILSSGPMVNLDEEDVVGKLSNAESGDQDSIPGKTRLLKERQHRCGYDHRDIIPTSSKSNSWKNKARK